MMTVTFVLISNVGNNMIISYYACIELKYNIDRFFALIAMHINIYL